MNKFLKVMEDVTNFIVGSESVVKLKEETPMGFTSEKKKRKKRKTTKEKEEVILDSLLAGVMLFSSFAARTPNVQPNPDDYEVSVGISNNNFHVNRQWERELGSFMLMIYFGIR